MLNIRLEQNNTIGNLTKGYVLLKIYQHKYWDNIMYLSYEIKTKGPFKVMLLQFCFVKMCNVDFFVPVTSLAGQSS